MLIEPFSMEELKSVVFPMEKNKIPRPHGLHVDFYQHFWEVVKGDLKDLLDDFHK